MQFIESAAFNITLRQLKHLQYDELQKKSSLTRGGCSSFPPIVGMPRPSKSIVFEHCYYVGRVIGTERHVFIGLDAHCIHDRCNLRHDLFKTHVITKKKVPQGGEKEKEQL